MAQTRTGTVTFPQPLEIGDVARVARRGARIEIGPKAIAAMTRSRAVVERCLRTGQAHYGINTGFGSLAKQRIDSEDLATLQRNLVRSHAAGAGEPLAREVVRGMMFLLVASLSRGMSGVRPVVAETIAGMLNRGVTPVVPSVGSVGASGDLAPLAAVALVAIGEGRAEHKGRVMDGGRAMRAAGLKPLTLEAKEGLALINGTHLMAAQGALLCADAMSLVDGATAALAMSIDACRATHAFLDHRLYAARQHVALQGAAMRVAALLDGSEIAGSHVENDPRVQDPYSLRAGPTVLGSAMAAIADIETAIETELGAVTDNPLVFPKGRVSLAVSDLDRAILEERGVGGMDVETDGGVMPLGRLFTDSIESAEAAIVSGANFHGMPLAMPLDYLAIAVCHLAGISERRTFLLTSAAEPEMRQRPYLVPSSRRAGLQSGLMIAQYSAAACVNEMIGLAMPASVSNLSTCAGMEDYNSFGPRAAAKARRSIELAARVIAIELVCAAQGLESHRPLKSGTGVEAVFRLVRRRVKTLSEDRPLTDDIEAVASLVLSGELTAVVDRRG